MTAKLITCPACMGSGSMITKGPTLIHRLPMDCSACKGTGKVEKPEPEDGITCPKCLGRGDRGIPGVDCGTCDGTGKIDKPLPDVPGPPNPPRPKHRRDHG